MAVHLLMVFRFAAAADAEAMRAKLAALQVTATVAHVRGDHEVHTNTRCLAHAESLIRFITKGGAQ